MLPPSWFPPTCWGDHSSPAAGHTASSAATRSLEEAILAQQELLHVAQKQ